MRLTVLNYLAMEPELYVISGITLHKACGREQIERAEAKSRHWTLEVLRMTFLEMMLFSITDQGLK